MGRKVSGSGIESTLDGPAWIRSRRFMTAPLTSLIYHSRHAPMYIPVLYRVTNVRNFQGCLPSWFREEHKDPPQALETSNSITNEIDDPPELLQPVPQGVSIEGTKRRHHHESNNIQEDEDASESEELDLLYGTAAPVRINHKLEEARRHHSKHKCKGWCYRGGNCTVDVDEVTYELRSVNCHCPHGYWGSRCELHFVARLFAPVKGHVEVEKSGVSALAFIILMLIVCIGLIFYSYRKIIRRDAAFDTSNFLSLNHHLRRPTSSFQAMTTTSINTTTPNNAGYSTRSTTVQQFNSRTPFSPFSRSYSHIAGNTRCSVTDLTPSLSTAFGRLSLIGSRIQHQLVEMPKIAVRNKNGDKKEEEEGSAYDEFVPAAAVASQYYMDQIHLEKPTKSEIQDALKKQDDGDEPLRPPGPCPSEYQLEALNQQLKALPMVVAFNEMEKKKATN
ncbi:hypothetical protein Q1695_005297 [Nippostrongylus brasiliensis]|nr:hypothetical protein Q1695_005297 [Nippostrongylus brasiliensis]